jgi:hypothetical protein
LGLTLDCRRIEQGVASERRLIEPGSVAAGRVTVHKGNARVGATTPRCDGKLDWLLHQVGVVEQVVDAGDARPRDPLTLTQLGRLGRFPGFDDWEQWAHRVVGSG